MFEAQKTNFIQQFSSRKYTPPPRTIHFYNSAALNFSKKIDEKLLP